MAKYNNDNDLTISITAMVGNDRTIGFRAKRIINSREEDIKRFLDAIEAKPTFISSILRMVGIKDLEKELNIIIGDDFKELVLELLNYNFGTDEKPLKFTPTNISSILGGSGRSAPKAIRELMSEKTIEGIKELINLGFTPNNISHILNGSGIRASKIVKELIANKDILRSLLLTKTPIEISSSPALHSIGNPEKVGTALEKIRDTEAKKIIKSLCEEETPVSTITNAKQRQNDNRQNQA
jgi:hypothetical protein